MGLFTNFQKAGPGIPKNAPKKRRLFNFFDIFFRKFWKLITLNLLYFLFCIPIITIGPATAGMTKVLRNFSQEKHAFIWMDFFEAFKKNFKQSLPIGIINTIFAVGVVLGFNIYSQMAAENKFFYIPFVICIAISATVLMMNFYIYLMIITVDLPLMQIIKNSFILTCTGIKTNIFTLIGIALAVGLPIIGSYYISSLFLFLFPVIIFSLTGLIICYNSYPIIQKHVIEPYYDTSSEENPEYTYLKPLEDDIFTDKGGTEKPINPKPKKTIS